MPTLDVPGASVLHKGGSLVIDFDAPLRGLQDEWPPDVWIVHYATAGKYACMNVDGVDGMVCFSDHDSAEYFGCSLAEALCLTSSVAVLNVSFDEARKIAKGRPAPIVALILFDNPIDPVVHFVK